MVSTSLTPSQVSGFSPTRMDLEMLRRFEGEDLQRCGWGDNKFNGDPWTSANLAGKLENGKCERVY